MTKFRLVLAFLPTLVSFCIMILFDAFLGLLKGRIGWPYVDPLVFYAHLVPALVLSAALLLISARRKPDVLKPLLYYGVIGLGAGILAIYLSVWSPELMGGRAGSMSIFGIIWGVPVYGMLGGVTGLVVGWIIHLIRLNSAR